MPKQIALKGAYTQAEAIANATITPGNLVEIMSTGKLRRHAFIGSSATSGTEKMFALEDDLVGRGLDDDYQVNDRVKYGTFEPGAEVYTFLKANTSCAVGDFLESDGIGNLQAASTPIEGSTIGMALEAITGGGGVVKRVKIRVA